MIKVLVLEDEKPIARNIARTIEQEHEGFQVVQIVPNGQQAIEVLEKEHIDVAFLDINVPKVTGLEVVGYMKQHHINTIPIILTGYQEFDYIQSAMRNGAKDYLLKPIDKIAMKEVLDKCYHIVYKNKMEEQLYLHKNQAEHVLIEQEENCAFGVFYIGSFMDAMLEEESQAEVERVERELTNLLKTEFLDSMFWIVNGKANNERFLFIKGEELRYQEKLTIIFNQAEFSIPVTLMVTDKRIPMSQVLTTYKNSVHILRSYIKLGVSSLLVGIPAIKEKEKFTKEEDLIRNIHSFSNKEQVFTILEEILSEVNYLTRVEVIYLMKHFFLHLCQEFSDNRRYLEMENETMYAVHISHSKEVLFEHIKKLISTYFFLEEEYEQNSQVLAEAIKRYLDCNFQIEFSNSILEEKMGYSQFYLRKIFKEVYGILPTAYLTQKRMEQAKELLKQNIQVKDVASQVGYMDPLYFSRAFKKAVGCSPKEFVTMQ
ncbi:MAG: response regulator [Eubacteriales bacterium]